MAQVGSQGKAITAQGESVLVERGGQLVVTANAAYFLDTSWDSHSRLAGMARLLIRK